MKNYCVQMYTFFVTNETGFCEKYKTNFRVPESANWLLKPAVNGIVFSEFVYNAV